MAESLKSKTIRGTIWSAFQKFGVMGLSFVANMILARKLSPDDFGCIAMLAIFLVISDTFMDGGLGSALIQKKSLSDRDSSTVFYFNLSLSTILYGVLYFSAPLISDFYRLDILTPVLRVQGLVLIINSFGVVQTSLLRKEMLFRKLAVANIVASIGSLAVAIALAFSGFGVWALVYQQIALSGIRVLCLWLLSNWRPKAGFSTESFRQLFGFGSFIFLSNMVNNLGNNIQGVIIGRAFNAGVLGYYSQAKKLEEMASTTFSNIIDQVTFPALAAKQRDLAAMAAVMRKLVKMIAFVSFPLMILLAITGEQIITICYGDQWQESVPYFRILCFAGIAICLQGVNFYAVAAIGKSKSIFTWTLIKRTVGIALMLIGLHWGIYGLLFGVVAASYFILLANAIQVQQYIRYTLWRQFKDVMPTIGGCLVSAAASIGVAFVLRQSFYVTALIEIVVFSSVYLLYSYLIKAESLVDIKDIAVSYIGKLKK